MIKITSKGSFQKTEQFLQRMKRKEHLKQLSKFGSIGVSALASATPKESSLTANSWSYTIVEKRGWYSIIWRNSHVENGTPIAVLIQYGHGTRNGGYVQGRDYINPAIRPVFDQILNDVRKAVKK